MEKFFKFLAENPEHQAKVQSFGGDVDALAVYVREQGYEISPEELKEYRDKALRALKDRMQKLQHPGASLSPGARAFLEFIKLAETDEKVAGRLAELGADSQGNPGEIIAYGKEKGFAFNEEDMKAAGESILNLSDELSEEELKMVAGGDPVLILGFVALAVAVAGGVVMVVKAVVDLLLKPRRSR